jgi:hypothetical protein
MKTFTIHATALALAATLAACGDETTGSTNETEVITTVMLIFTPDGGGTTATFEFDDPDGDGGNAPMVDAIDLAPGSYSMTVAFENRLETPAEDITAEVMDEADEHQIFLTGSAVDGPAADNSGAPLTHTYADTDNNGLPIGLSNHITATAGSGDLIVSLRHMPPINDQAVKEATSAADVSSAGFTAIGGTTDAQVTFPVTVQ